MSDTKLWAELLAYGTGIGLSPIHLAVLLLLLLGPQPLHRGGWFVAGWVVTTMATSALLVTVGHALVLDMTHGSHHRTGLDLLAGGALIAIGVRELLRSFTDGDAPPAWTSGVDRFVAMPLPLLLLFGAVGEIASPDDLVLFAIRRGCFGSSAAHLARTHRSAGLHHRCEPVADHAPNCSLSRSPKGFATLRTRQTSALCSRRAGRSNHQYWTRKLSRMARNERAHSDLSARDQRSPA